jgi:hypothetical protein
MRCDSGRWQRIKKAAKQPKKPKFFALEMAYFGLQVGVSDGWRAIHILQAMRNTQSLGTKGKE